MQEKYLQGEGSQVSVEVLAAWQQAEGHLRTLEESGPRVHPGKRSPPIDSWLPGSYGAAGKHRRRWLRGRSSPLQQGEARSAVVAGVPVLSCLFAEYMPSRSSVLEVNRRSPPASAVLSPARRRAGSGAAPWRPTPGAGCYCLALARGGISCLPPRQCGVPFAPSPLLAHGRLRGSSAHQRRSDLVCFVMLAAAWTPLIDGNGAGPRRRARAAAVCDRCPKSVLGRAGL